MEVDRRIKEQANMKDYTRNTYEDSSGKTHFDKLSENLTQTIDMWKDQGYEEIDLKKITEYFGSGIKFLQNNGNYGEKYRAKKRIKFRYIRTDKKARMGGIITSLVKDDLGKFYLIFLNFAVKKVFSVQLEDIKHIFFAEVNRKKVLSDEEQGKLTEGFDLVKYYNAKKLWNYIKSQRDTNPEFAKGLTKKYLLAFFKNQSKRT